MEIEIGTRLKNRDIAAQSDSLEAGHTSRIALILWANPSALASEVRAAEAIVFDDSIRVSAQY